MSSRHDASVARAPGDLYSDPCSGRPTLRPATTPATNSRTSGSRGRRTRGRHEAGLAVAEQRAGRARPRRRGRWCRLERPASVRADPGQQPCSAGRRQATAVVSSAIWPPRPLGPRPPSSPLARRPAASRGAPWPRLGCRVSSRAHAPADRAFAPQDPDPGAGLSGSATLLPPADRSSRTSLRPHRDQEAGERPGLGAPARTQRRPVETPDENR